MPGRDARLEPCHAAVYGVLGHDSIERKYTVHINDIEGKEERHGEHTHHDHAPRPGPQGPGHDPENALGGGWDKSLPVKVGYAGNEGGLE